MTQSGKKTGKRLLTKIGLGLIATALPALATIKYNSWRNEPVPRENVSLTAPRYFDLDSAKGANRQLLDFPTEIPGAAKVDRYLTPDARYCLVHIRQKHLVDDTPEELKEEISSVQGDIHSILDYLTTKQKVSGVYTEAVTRSSEDMVNDLAELSRKLNEIHVKNETRIRKQIGDLERKIKRLREGSAIPWEAINKYPNDPTATEKYILDLKEELAQTQAGLPLAIEKDRQDEQKQRDANQYDAVQKLAVERGIKIFAAEEDSANMRAAVAAQMQRVRGDSLELRSAILDDREDILLRQVADQTEPIALCVYGGSHVWGGRNSCGANYNPNKRPSLKDNITIWNRENPNRKFSLIEITPRSYKELADN